MALSIAPFSSRGGPMGRKVTFTPRRFLRKIWQLGNFDVSRDGRRLAYAANKGKQWSVYVMYLRTKRTKILLRSEQSVVQPEFSPDGKWLAVQSDFEGDENYNIYVTPAAGGKARKVTDTPWDSASPRWSPDGRRIAFLSNRDGDRDNVFVVDASEGEAKQLTNVDDIVTEIAWRPDGRTIAFSAGVGLLDYVGLADLTGRMEKLVAFPNSECSIGGEPGPDRNRDGDRDNVFVVDASEGEAKQLTNVDEIVTEIAWRPNGTTIAFSAGVGLLDYVGRVDLTGRMEKLVAFPNSECSIGGEPGRPEPWSPDGLELAFVSNLHDHLDIGIIDLETRRVRWAVENRWDKTMPLWSPDGRRIAYLENHDGNIQLKTVSRDGSGVRSVSPARGSASHAAWHPDGAGLLYYHSTFTQPHRLLLRRGGRTTTLVDSLQGKLPTSELVDGELIRYRSFDGREIPAWLFEPRKGRSRHAAVLDPHGGPESQTVNEWRPRFQFMLAEGFTILAPNYRGGTGSGRAWRRLSDRDLGGGDMQDIIAGGRWLRESRGFPRERLGVVGVSYGGYAVAHVLEQAPEQWAVGVSIVGYFNWLTATTNERGYLRRYDRQEMGHPDTEADQ